MQNVEIKNLTFAYTEDFPVYRNFSVSFAAGTITAIVGKSGCGKTTLLNIIASAEETSYLFQEPRLLPWRTLKKNIMLVLAAKMDKDCADKTAAKMLSRVGLADRLNAFPADISGGERQRAALARAFAYPASVLLMDEAFQSQDTALKIKLMDNFLFLRAEEAENRRTAILVTHDIREALCLAERIIVLDGRPVHIALDRQLEPRTVSVYEAYTNPPEHLRRIERDVFAMLECSARQAD